ncbi:MAG: ATP-binding cassette domain-containing protein [Bifidobacteriaceae bacterium]|jgi:energy-coupling factor transport system ATP-binding protein|nr:ATP-binding cassette domain-containing protein [Bifidobacteriaceae bacterium]
MIEFQDLTFAYPAPDMAAPESAPGPVLRGVSLRFGRGDLALVTGPTGVGKSTLLRAVNGLVPHFTGGKLTGRVLVDGRSASDEPPRKLADLVGYVGQDPAAGFVADRVDDELAYALEQLGTPVPTMRARVEEIIDLFGLGEFRARDPGALSAGQAQRVAIGAALTAHPKVLVLDEPTSALDPAAAEDLMAAIGRLVDDLDITVIMAEHRLERVIQLADQVIRVHPGGAVDIGPPRAQLADSAVAPPLVRLARALRLDPLPLTVREARRAVRAWTQLHDAVPTAPAPAALPPPGSPTAPPTAAAGPVVLSKRGISFSHPGPVHAVRGVDLDIYGGEVTGMMGRNGAGKTSLLWALAQDRAVRDQMALVPSEPTDLFCASTVRAELPTPAADAALDWLAPGIRRASHPRDLSEGQQLALALAVQLTAQTELVALDEPTRGLDYDAKDRLTQLLRQLAQQGRGVLVASHDVEFLAGAADRIVWLAEGRVVADGRAADLLLSVPAHAPQVAKVTAPANHLTVEAALAAMGV